MTASPIQRFSRPTLRALTSLQGIDRSGLDPEERAGLETFIQGVLRRWAVLALITVFNLWAAFVELTVVGAGIVWAIALVCALFNFTLSAIPRGSGYHRMFPHLSLALDVLITATPLVFLGAPGASAFLFLAILPYASVDTLRVRLVHSLAAPVAYLGAMAFHQVLGNEPMTDVLNAQNYFISAALFITTLLLRWQLTLSLERVTRARHVIEEAASGALYSRLPDEGNDELGQMTEAINAMLRRINRTVMEVQREAREVAAFAEMLSMSAQGVLGSTQTVFDTAKGLAGEMNSQRERAEDGQDRTADAAAAAASLRDRADRMAAGIQQLVADAQGGRERVQRASETLIAIAEDVRHTAATVQDLSSMSNDIGNFVHTTSRIARQTHVLALNAAIEAAHSGAGNEGFSAVAEEVRTLAATSAESARNAAEIIETVRSHIGTVARSMGAGEVQVRDVGVVAGEAKDALDALVKGASEVSELVRVTADISRSQAGRMSELAQQMAEIAEVNARTSADAQGAADAMGSQRVTMEDLNTISTQLAGLAERLANSVDEFQVQRPDRSTLDFSVGPQDN